MAHHAGSRNTTPDGARAAHSSTDSPGSPCRRPVQTAILRLRIDVAAAAVIAVALLGPSSVRADDPRDVGSRHRKQLRELTVDQGPSGHPRTTHKQAALLARWRALGPPNGLVPPELLGDPPLLPYPDELLSVDPPPAGTIELKYVVSVDGSAVEIEVVRGVHPVLDELATAALAALRFRPATYEGQAVEVALTMQIDVRPPTPTDASVGDVEDEQCEGGDGASIDCDPGPDAAAVPGPAVVLGRVREAGQRVPLSGVSIVVFQVPRGDVRGESPSPKPASTKRTKPPVSKRRASRSAELVDPREAEVGRANSDESGRFRIEGLDLGPVRIVALSAGYERIEILDELKEGSELELRIDLVPERMGKGYRTVVASTAQREEISKRKLEIAEVNALPGGQGDALRALSSLPGVARPAFGVGLLVIRGAAPFDSAIYFGEHQIPLLFHFGALTTSVNSDALESITFVPSNYDARYGNAIGGVVAVQPRVGRRDGHHGYVDADLLDAGAMAEGPMGKGSYLASFRRSYIDAVLAAVSPDTGSLGISRAPRYLDYQAFLDHPVGPGSLTFRALGSDDRFRFLNQPANDSQTDTRNQGGLEASIHRADLVYRVRSGRYEMMVSPSYRFEFGRGVTGPQYAFDVWRHAVSTRATLEAKLSRRASIEFGAETIAIANIIDATAAPIAASPVPSADGLVNPAPTVTSDELVVDRSRGLTGNIAHWISASIGLGARFRLLPGLRTTYFITPIERFSVDPRIRFALDITATTQLRGGAGLYSQTPLFQELSVAFGNPNLAPYRALHTSLEIEQKLPQEWSIALAGFHNRMWDLATLSPDSLIKSSASTSTTQSERLRSTGQGRAYGLEFMVRKQLTRAFMGWLSYTLMRSERSAEPDAPWYAFDYDQRHIFSAVGAFALPRNWRIGARVRASSGNPYTPIQGSVLDAATGDYVPLQGLRNSGRLPPFGQIDLRVDKRWVLRNLSVMAYLDLQNAANTRNVELWTYSFDYRVRTAVTGLPILPGFGLRLEW